MSKAAPLSRAEKLVFYKSIKLKMIARARRDPAFFNEYVLAHEKTGKPIKNADFHRAWHEFLSKNRWGVIFAPIEHGKSFSISVGRILWELGRDPDLRILLIGRNGPMAEKSLRLIRQQIEYNKRLKEVFPKLQKSFRTGDPWSGSDITVDRSYYSRDPSVQARGMGSTNILSSRLDLIVFDDGLDLDNTRTKFQRDQSEEWWFTVVFSRLVDDYETMEFGRVFAIGTPFNDDDLLHRLSRRKGWAFAHYSCVENLEDPPEKWRPIWPRVWPLQRILDKRGGMTITAFARMLLCMVLDAASRRFKKAWIEHSKRLGRGRTFLVSQPTENGRLMKTFTGIDLGIGKKKSDALTSLYTLAVDSRRRRILIDLETGHWDGPEILRKIDEKETMFDSEVVVEGNAAQKFIAEFAVEFFGTSARAVNTGSEKWDDEYGVESLAVLMKCGLFVVPSGDTGDDLDPEAEAFLDECWNFDPEQHTGDRLMSGWIAEKGVREYLEPRSSDNSDHNYR